MKLRNGIIYITLAVILLVFSTMAAIYVHNMSKISIEARVRR